MKVNVFPLKPDKTPAVKTWGVNNKSAIDLSSITEAPYDTYAIVPIDFVIVDFDINGIKTDNKVYDKSELLAYKDLQSLKIKFLNKVLELYNLPNSAVVNTPRGLHVYYKEKENSGGWVAKIIGSWYIKIGNITVTYAIDIRANCTKRTKGYIIGEGSYTSYKGFEGKYYYKWYRGLDKIATIKSIKDHNLRKYQLKDKGNKNNKGGGGNKGGGDKDLRDKIKTLLRGIDMGSDIETAVDIIVKELNWSQGHFDHIGAVTQVLYEKCFDTAVIPDMVKDIYTKSEYLSKNIKSNYEEVYNRSNDYILKLDDVEEKDFDRVREKRNSNFSLVESKERAEKVINKNKVDNKIFTLPAGMEHIGRGAIDDFDYMKPGGEWYEGDIRWVISRAGSGKTDVAIDRLPDNHLIISINHNISTTKQSAKLHDLLYYDDVKRWSENKLRKELSNSNGIATTGKSAKRIYDKLDRCNLLTDKYNYYVVWDEILPGVSSLIKLKRNYIRPLYTSEEIKGIFKWVATYKSNLLDATIDITSVEIINTALRKYITDYRMPNKTITLLYNPINPLHKKVHFVDENSWLWGIEETLSKGESTYAFCNSEGLCNAIKEYFITSGCLTEDEIITITAPTKRTDKRIKEMMELPQQAWGKYKLIIYNTAYNRGINVSFHDKFKKCFVIFDRQCRMYD